MRVTLILRGRKNIWLLARAAFHLLRHGTATISAPFGREVQASVGSPAFVVRRDLRKVDAKRLH